VRVSLSLVPFVPLSWSLFQEPDPLPGAGTGGPGGRRGRGTDPGTGGETPGIESCACAFPPFLLSVIGAVLCGSALVCNADPDPAFYSLLLLPALLLHYTKLLRKKQKYPFFCNPQSYFSFSFRVLVVKFFLPCYLGYNSETLELVSESKASLLHVSVLRLRVSDPYSFDTDPDPGCLWPKTEKKITAEKKLNFFYQNYNLPIPRPP
jgi:hypothetical protein